MELDRGIKIEKSKNSPSPHSLFFPLIMGLDWGQMTQTMIWQNITHEKCDGGEQIKIAQEKTTVAPFCFSITDR